MESDDSILAIVVRHRAGHLASSLSHGVVETTASNFWVFTGAYITGPIQEYCIFYICIAVLLFG